MRIQLTGGTSLLLGTLLVASASAQSQIQAKSVTGPVKNAGVYHAATGTWTRANTQTAAGADVIYNNIGAISYFTTMPDNVTQLQFEITDQMRLPTDISGGGEGSSTAYDVNGLFFAYCSSAGIGAAVTMNWSFDDVGVAPCTNDAVGAAGAFAVTGLPTSATAGTQGCWLITIDLSNSTDAFSMAADQDGFFDGSANLDSAAYTISFTGHGGATGAGANTTGPILFGDPFNSAYGDGTNPAWGYGAGPDGTGLGQADFFWIETPALAGPGCYFFGGYPAAPWGGFYASLTGKDSGGSGGPGEICVTSPNSVGAGGVVTHISGFGTAAATFDIDGIPLQPGILFVGTNNLPSFPFGCGTLCVGGSVVRGAVLFPMAMTGNSHLGIVRDMSAGPQTNVQYWYRDPIGCATGWNLSNALAQ